MLKHVEPCSSSLHYIPLKELIVETTIRGYAADVNVTQLFFHHGKHPIDAICYIPVDDSMTIYRLSIESDDRQTQMEIKEKRDEFVGTFSHFDRTVDEHWLINLKNVLPLKTYRIVLSYVVELDRIQNSFVRFTILTNTLPKLICEKHENGSRSNECLPLNSYKIRFRCQIENLTGLNCKRINSSSHKIHIDTTSNDVVRFEEENSFFHSDFLLDIEYVEPTSNPFVVLESTAAMATFVRSENLLETLCDNSSSLEIIFLVDCSSSMRNEQKILSIRQAMFFFLKNLPSSCHFNLILFGCVTGQLFNTTSVVANRLHIALAEKFVRSINADLGNTDLFNAFLWFQRFPVEQNRFRRVIFMTDGGANDRLDVFEICRSISKSTRIFSLAFGVSPNRSLIRKISFLTNANSMFVLTVDQIESVANELLQKVFRPSEFPSTFDDFSETIRSSYDRSIIYCLFENEFSGEIIGKLAIRSLLDNLFDRFRLNPTNELRQRIIELSIKHKIVSRLTTPVGIDIVVNRSNQDDRAMRAAIFLVKTQQVDGLWEFESIRNFLERWTGESLNVFDRVKAERSTRMLIGAITMIVMEQKLNDYRTIWEPASDRARQRLLHLLNNDWKAFVSLLKDMRTIICVKNV